MRDVDRDRLGVALADDPREQIPLPRADKLRPPSDGWIDRVTRDVGLVQPALRAPAERQALHAAPGAAIREHIDRAPPRAGGGRSNEGPDAGILVVFAHRDDPHVDAV